MPVFKLKLVYVSILLANNDVRKSIECSTLEILPIEFHIVSHQKADKLYALGWGELAFNFHLVNPGKYQI
jgi:hypothetical protein